MTEKQIQDDLFLYYGRSKWGKKAKLMCDCIYLFERWESDFIVLLNSGYIVELEIKTSKADYFADQKKIERHKCLSGKIACKRPNKFLFVVPIGMIDVKDIPSYAGLLYYLPEDHWFVEVKPAPFLHKTKMNLFKELCTKFYYKYLNLRKK